jgi:hypothetical protein
MPRLHLLLSVLILSLTSLCGAYRAHAQNTATPARYQKMLFVGNSITRHGPKSDLGWEGNWGMAASAEAKDYVHLVARAITGPSGKAPEVMIKGGAEFERGYANYDTAGKMKDAADFGADLIIVAIGENVPGLNNAEEKQKFQERVTELLRMLKSDRKPTLLVRSSFWANGAKDEALKKACAEAGGIFVDISTLDKDESNYARSERPYKHEGVARHPGDKGMQAIADALLKALPK